MATRGEAAGNDRRKARAFVGYDFAMNATRTETTLTRCRARAIVAGPRAAS